MSLSDNATEIILGGLLLTFIGAITLWPDDTKPKSPPAITQSFNHGSVVCPKVGDDIRPGFNTTVVTVGKDRYACPAGP